MNSGSTFLQDKNNRAIINALKPTVYLNKDIMYLNNVKITEYDIKSAGWTVIKHKKLLPEKDLAYLETCTKYERNVFIGKRIRENPKINEILLSEFEKARCAFGVINQINPAYVLSIKKDAIFVIKERPRTLKVGYFEFVPKNTYTSYAYLNGCEFYYNQEQLDIKGISEENIEKCEAFLKYLKNIFRVSELYTGEKLIKMLKRYSKDYLGGLLPIETYRELKSGLFSLKWSSYKIESLDSFNDADIRDNFLRYVNPLISNII